MVDPAPSRRAPTWLLVAVIASSLPWSWFVNLWFAPRGLYRPLSHWSGGLLHPTLQVCLPALVLYLLLLRAGGLRPRDVGWRAADLRAGVLATVALWLGCNAVALLAPGGDGAHDGQEGGPLLAVAGRLLGQLLGTALLEETLYRGFCLTQFLMSLRARGVRRQVAAPVAAALSAVVFAIPHIPNRMFKGAYESAADVLADQAMLACSGVLLAWVYLRTRNLWWGVGLHALANCPTLVVPWGWGGSPKAAVAVLGLGLTALWPWLARRRQAPG
jgi:membrane protease YdiL (CAAX protease family)